MNSTGIENHSILRCVFLSLAVTSHSYALNWPRAVGDSNLSLLTSNTLNAGIFATGIFVVLGLSL